MPSLPMGAHLELKILFYKICHFYEKRATKILKLLFLNINLLKIKVSYKDLIKYLINIFKESKLRNKNLKNFIACFSLKMLFSKEKYRKFHRILFTLQYKRKMGCNFDSYEFKNSFFLNWKFTAHLVDVRYFSVGNVIFDEKTYNKFLNFCL